VPEELRPAQQPAIPAFSAPLTVNLGGLMGSLNTLKTVKQLARDGQQAEAARLYQETFGVSDQEAKDLVSRLAAGQSVVLSNVSFGTPVPVVSGTRVQVVSGPQAAQAAQFWREQIGVAQQQQRKQVGVVLGVVVLLAIVFLSILFSVILGAPFLCGILGMAS